MMADDKLRKKRSRGEKDGKTSSPTKEFSPSKAEKERGTKKNAVVSDAKTSAHVKKDKDSSPSKDNASSAAAKWLTKVSPPPTDELTGSAYKRKKSPSDGRPSSPGKKTSSKGSGSLAPAVGNRSKDSNSSSPPGTNGRPPSNDSTPPDIEGKVRRETSAAADPRKVAQLVEEFKIPRGAAVTFVKRGDKIIKKLGTGSYADVFLIKTADNKDMAAKVIDTEKTSEHYREKALPREISVLTKLVHPNIINTYAIIGYDKVIVILMEFASCGSLGDILKENGGAFPEYPDVNVIFWKITGAVEYMHKKNLAVHRDLKLENILLSSQTEPKLTDFSYAKNYLPDDKHLAKTVCGSPIYLPPEMLHMLLGKLDPENTHHKLNKYDPFKADIWSLGVCLVLMLLRAVPFQVYDENNAASVKVQLDQQMKKKWLITPEQEAKISKDALDLIKHMLEPHVQVRYDITQVRQHQWLRNVRLQQEAIDKAQREKASTK